MVDKQLRDIMRRTRDRPNALQAGTSPGYVDIFQKSNETLDKIQKNLEDYLETKRMAFPRFYFVAAADLLDILSKGSDPQKILRHLSKNFDSLNNLEFTRDDAGAHDAGTHPSATIANPLPKSLSPRPRCPGPSKAASDAVRAS